MRRKPEWDRTVRYVFMRAGGLCEMCAKPDLPLDPHHCFGRSNQIPRQWADRAELIAAICRSCHGEVTDHPRGYWANVLRIRAARRLCKAIGVEAIGVFEQGLTPLQLVRAVIREQEERKAA